VWRYGHYHIKIYKENIIESQNLRIQSVVGKDPVELEKYLEKKIALPEEDIST
jgi:hypothetical protein